MADPAALVRSDLGGPGIRRRRHGRGFRYLGPDGQPVGDPEVLARVGGRSEGLRIRRAPRRAIARVVREVSDYLGNTPAVARASYIDPRVIEFYEEGTTIAAALGLLGQQSEFGELATQGAAEAAVLRLLSGSP